MGTPAFPDLGAHCAVSECSLIDFLPFNCDGCRKIFCLEHRSYGSHKCSVGNKEDVTVIICPMCAKTVRLVPKEDPNVTWEKHVETNCDPSSYRQATQKPKCPVQGCREILTFSNKVRCKDCGREVCLKHRFGLDHKCQELRKADAAKNVSFFGSQYNKYFKEKGAVGGTKSQSASSGTSVKEKLSKIGSSVVGPLSSKPPQVKPTSSGSTPRPLAGQTSARRELCPQCGLRCNTVMELIQHAESAHASGGQWRIGSSQDQLDVCPKCGRGFDNAVALVNHVERDHGGTSGAPGEKCTIS